MRAGRAQVHWEVATINGAPPPHQAPPLTEYIPRTPTRR
jgi:hypothetical protein